jgi:hypothetical protein
MEMLYRQLQEFLKRKCNFDSVPRQAFSHRPLCVVVTKPYIDQFDMHGASQFQMNLMERRYVM